MKPGDRGYKESGRAQRNRLYYTDGGGLLLYEDEPCWQTTIKIKWCREKVYWHTLLDVGKEYTGKFLNHVLTENTDIAKETYKVMLGA